MIYINNLYVQGVQCKKWDKTLCSLNCVLRFAISGLSTKIKILRAIEVFFPPKFSFTPQSCIYCCFKLLRKLHFFSIFVQSMQDIAHINAEKFPYSTIILGHPVSLYVMYKSHEGVLLLTSEKKVLV